jgi:cytochrome c oxidase subunit 4
MRSIASPGTYVLVFLGLIGLTAITVAAGHVDLGAWHGPVGLGIAAIKAALIVMYFMHVGRSNRLIWVIAVSGLFWLGLLIGLTMTDVLTRAWPTYP